MSQKNKFTKAKILLLGAEGVGKTAFAVRFITKRFIGEYDPNKEMLYTTKAHVDKDEIALEILDTATQDEEAVLENHIRWADGFVLLYAVTDKPSLHKIHYLHSVISHLIRPHDVHVDDRLPLVLVGTKTDQLHARQVTKEDGARLAQRLHCNHFEISAAESADGAANVMDTLLKHVKRDYFKLMAFGGKRATPFTSVKSVFKKKIYRSRSDTLQ